MNVPEPVNSVEEDDDLGVEDDMVQGSSRGMLSSGFAAAFGQILRDKRGIEWVAEYVQLM
jgi:hypothetical protein